MRRVAFVAVLCAFVAAPAFADMAVNVQTSVTGRWGTTRGGDFLMTVLPTTMGGDPIGIYGVGSSFTTFCVETDEFVSDNDYYVTVRSDAWQGGTAGPEPDPLSPQSAYLYSLWLDSGIAHNTTNANDIQQAIWWLEQETGWGVDNYLVAQANTAVAVGGSWYNTWGADSIGDIRVMNLWTNVDHTGNAQDMLVRVPLPAAVLLGMLGLGAAGLKLRRFA